MRARMRQSTAAASQSFLSGEDVRKLDRDLRILIATDGTLTRMLGVLADDEIVVQIVGQHIRHDEPDLSGSGRLPGGRLLQRHILLKGRSSGNPFVAAESLIAVDLLPPAITENLTTTDRPIGEVISGCCLETSKEAATVWMGELPDWLVPAGPRSSPSRTAVARRYRIISAGQPVLLITEYFLPHIFRVPTAHVAPLSP